MTFENKLADLYPWICSLARKYCKDMDDAKDLANDTVLKMLQNKNIYNPSKPLKPWCMVVMQNTYFTSYRRKTLLDFVAIDSIVEPESFFNPISDLYYKNLCSIIRRYIENNKSVACVLYYAYGYSYDEISAIQKIPVGTVRSRINAGRKLLRNALYLNS